jgi:hypothetical protein
VSPSEFVMSIPYRAEKDDLYDPAKHAVLFPAGRPKSDAALRAELSRQANCRLEPRYVDCCDIITYVAPKNFGYAHLEEPYSMNLARQVKFNPPQTDIDNHRTQAEKEYIEKYAWKIGDVFLRPLADQASGNHVWTRDSRHSLAPATPRERLAA